MKLIKGILEKRKDASFCIYTLVCMMFFTPKVDIVASTYKETYAANISASVIAKSNHNTAHTSENKTLQATLEATQQELERQISQRNILLAIFGLSIMVVVALYIQCKHKKKSELKLQMLNEEVLRKSQQLHQINEERNNIMRIIAHDLRSPISSFENLSKLILFYLHKNRTEDLKELMHDLDLSVHSLNNTLNNLLNLAFDSETNSALSTEITSVNELSKDVNTMLQSKILEKNIQINYHIPEESVFNINPEILKVVLRNILDNAIKFSEKGSQIDLHFTENKTQAQLSIVDCGTGISPEKLAEIFVPYAHKQSTGTAGEKGLGVGLILSNKLINAYDGQIKIKSKLNEGSEVTIIIPKKENHENSDFSCGG